MNAKKLLEQVCSQLQNLGLSNVVLISEKKPVDYCKNLDAFIDEVKFENFSHIWITEIKSEGKTAYLHYDFIQASESDTEAENRIVHRLLEGIIEQALVDRISLVKEGYIFGNIL